MNVSRNPKLVIGIINWKNWLSVSPEILKQARPIKIHISLIIRIFHNSENILDSPGHDTTLFSGLTMQRIGLSWLRGSKEDDSTIFTLDKGLYDWFDALTVELILSLNFAEDIVELKKIRIIAIVSTVLPKQKLYCQNTGRNAPLLYIHEYITKINKIIVYQL